MTPAARYASAIEVLDAHLAGKPAEQALTTWARHSRFAGSKDRAAVRDHVFDVLRRKRSCAALGGGETGRGLILGLLRQQDIDPRDVFTGEGHAPAPLTEAERATGVATDRDRMDLPDWLVERFCADLATQAEGVAEALRHRAPVMLRVNLMRSCVEDAVASLAAEGITAVPDAMSSSALRVEGVARGVSQSQAYVQGLVELQDGSSQAVVDELPIARGCKVLDFCAGGGGKTLAMAGRVAARYHAHDINPERLKDLSVRAERAGVRVAEIATRNLAATGPFDLVLCDAPCSGSGAWRRSPEGKWALTEARLDALNAIQTEVLSSAARLVAKGGVLAYATCSVLACENEGAVSHFVDNTDGWKVNFTRNWLPGASGDGFFLALLTRE